MACRQALQRIVEDPQAISEKSWVKPIKDLLAAGELAQLKSVASLCRQIMQLEEEKNDVLAPLLNSVLELLKELTSTSYREGAWQIKAKDLQHEIGERSAKKEGLKSITPPSHRQTYQTGVGKEGYYELFLTDLELQCNTLITKLLEIEQNPDKHPARDELMRAAHSIKGAARVLGLSDVVHLAHLIEECFDQSKDRFHLLNDQNIEAVFSAVDFLKQMTIQPSTGLYEYLENQKKNIQLLCKDLESSLYQNLEETETKKEHAAAAIENADVEQESLKEPLSLLASMPTQPTLPQKNALKADGLPKERVLRITADILNRLMALAGESLVESHWLEPFGDSLSALKRDYAFILELLDKLRLTSFTAGDRNKADELLRRLTVQAHQIQHQLSSKANEFELFSRRHTNISERLYNEVLKSRMRPFSDALGGFPKMVRDLAKELGKKVRLQLSGKSTAVDREILEKLETPLAHMLRNAIDHGIETPQERLKLSKNEEGLILVSAQHRGGMLVIEVRDDGRGLCVSKIKEIAKRKRLAPEEVIDSLSEQEAYDFIFLPGFSSASAVTELSGRGVGLSVVHSFVQEIGGRIHVTTQESLGLCFHMILPLTLSVMRALLVKIAEEPYAIALAKIDSLHCLAKEEIKEMEGCLYFSDGKKTVGLTAASAVLGLSEGLITQEFNYVVVVSDEQYSYGLIVDSFIGEKELVVHELDPLLGKVTNISAGAFMGDGSPILILDVEDLIRSVDLLLKGVHSRGKSKLQQVFTKGLTKRILVVDDSLTVREVEARLLESQGYTVDCAVNGMDGWNALRTNDYDLMIADIDMPRMNGIELIKTVRADPRLSRLPIIIVSYKEREEDRQLGLQAGANVYLTKSSFQDRELIETVNAILGSSMPASSDKNS